MPSPSRTYLGASLAALSFLAAAGPALAQEAPAAEPTASPAPSSAPKPVAAPVTAPAAAPAQDQVANPAAAATDSPPPADDATSDQPGIVVEGSGFSRQDPIHQLNEKSYEAIQTGDRLVVAPAAKLYAKGIPSPMRKGLHNVIYNLREPSNFLGFLLEHKFGKAGQTLVRFTINSTVGLVGLIDVARAKPIGIPYRPNGLADAAAFYGIGSGPYLFLPLIGPTTLRDLIGVTFDRTWFPLVVGGPFNSVAYGLGITVIGGLDDRNAIDPQLRAFREKSSDPYRATRDFYLKRRNAEIEALRHPHAHPEADDVTEPAKPDQPPAAQDAQPQPAIQPEAQPVAQPETPASPQI